MVSISSTNDVNFELMNLGVATGNSANAKGENIKDLEGAAGQFESIFLKMFLDQARQSKLSDDLLGSSASDNFQEMFDNELSQAGGSSLNLGLTEVIVRQLRIDQVK